MKKILTWQDSSRTHTIDHSLGLVFFRTQIIAHPYLAFHGSTEVETPDEYLCPITHELMRDPVIASDGYSYERSAIAAWLGSGGDPVSPMTNDPLLSPTLTPNRSLKLLIERFLS